MLFNLAGIGLIWPIARVRNVPSVCAEWLAGQAARNRMISVAFIALVFFVLPLVIILLFGPDLSAVPAPTE